ncbi:MAG: chromosome segregation protein SMC [Lachnospiraceae bacterium]
MYLKSIEVQGFKSFANRMTFDFHNGITGIVGPNGSGKSNVADAVRWVLGEQSAKQLRGANMQDVIFAGTENRKPLSFAYVAITLDNSDHRLNLDFEEVTVARRVYRSGESEYLINGTSCRLKDVHELFYDTGIGKEGYSIIGQGQVEKILSGKPEERRELFDEAAGIVKFKRRKQAAQKKLESEHDNLLRISDILSELERQVGPLEKQAAKAKQFLQLKSEQKEFDIRLFLKDMHKMETESKDLEYNRSLAMEQTENFKEQYQRIKTEYEELEQEIQGLDELIQTEKDSTGQDELLKGRMEGQIEILKEQIKSLSVSDDHYKNRVLGIETEKNARMEEASQHRTKQQGCEAQVETVAESLKTAEAEWKELQQSITESSQLVEDGKSELIELLNRKTSLKTNQQRLTTMSEQINIRKAQLSQKILQRKTEEQSVIDTLLQLESQNEKLEQEVELCLEKERKKKEEIKEWHLKRNRNAMDMESQSKSYHQNYSRMESLKNIAERYDGYGNSIRRVMEQKEKETGLIGVISDLIRVSKEHETAIETALGGRIQNIVTADEETAKKMISYLKANKYGRATFLPLNAVESRGEYRYPQALQEPGVIGLAHQLIECDPQYKKIIQSLAGGILVVDHIDRAVKIARKYRYTLHIVTLEGESLSAGGSMTGGAFKNNSNLLGRNREIEELELKCKEMQKEQIQLSHRKEEIETAIALLTDDLEESVQMRQEILMSKHSVQTQIDNLAQQKSEQDQLFKSTQFENSELERQISEIRTEQEEVTRGQDEIDFRQQEMEKNISKWQQELEEHEYLETSASQKIAQIQIEHAGVLQSLDFARENLQRVTAEIERYDIQIKELTEEAEHAKGDVKVKEQEITDLLSGIRDAETKISENKKETLLQQEKREKLTITQKEFFDKREKISESLNDLDKELYRLNSMLEKNDEIKSSRIQYIWEEYELTPRQSLELFDEIEVSHQQLKQQLGELKDKIKNLGNVNVNAIEEYKEVSERYTFLHDQHSDLVEAEEELRKIIAELDEGMRAQFTEKFQLIQKEFDKAFKELFGGGKGTLELMEGEDLLESGVRIIAQPPGKKLQNMVLLSGGEKALTAIALLFAIQNLKPSPFCLLDEIEAALDDSNVGRFADYLHKLTASTQFIMITHRRGTMAASDRLYGITMQEKGVSTMVSVNLIEHQLNK